MDQTLRLEAQAISAARRGGCVQHAQVADGGLRAGEVQILPAGRLRSMLRNNSRQLGEADAAAPVSHALSGAAPGRPMPRPAS
jgi:hypothetical protein